MKTSNYTAIEYLSQLMLGYKVLTDKLKRQAMIQNLRVQKK